MPLMRLAYASTATFEAEPVKRGIEPHVARILMESRRNNAKNQLVGGLYYGDNRFFQYLEGDERAVLELYQRIKADPRHRDVITLIQEPLPKRTFTDWSMKYVPLSGDVQQFLERHGLVEFQPASFDAAQCEEMVELIRASRHDQKVVNHDEATRHRRPESRGISRGMMAGLLLASACVIGGLVATGVSL
ncbi:BLUF domain-containing protein [Marinobacter salinisoli]|uniref:BLUF domain-containing protein n=1 Tax=Marinobacter salinisoli TaxID=2769486 RepID=A0ABX7MQM3_9GAMM|nr:BLUF domain-containing protein [Marinobacter salinisoli]QSP94615.1 BLUF domain-containing protein [Marinobacter salinisoli]